MIYYCVTRVDPYTITRRMPKHWLQEIKKRIRIVLYDQLVKKTRLDAGVYIFTNVEALDPKTTNRSGKIWNHLRDALGANATLNHPSLTPRRYELLRLLHANGINRFQAHRLTSGIRPEKFPVFIRNENEHDMYENVLLRNAEEFESEVAAIERAGRSRDDKLVVEFCNTKSVDGLYRKYAAFIIDDTIIPRHMCFGDNWILKHPKHNETALLEEEKRYVAENPHKKELKEIFKLLRTNYGRIDYGIVDGRIQVWEINTNASLFGNDTTEDPRAGINADFFNRYISAIDILNAKSPAGPKVQVGEKITLLQILQRKMRWLKRRLNERLVSR